MPNSSGSLLLGLDGVVVESVTINDEHTRTVHVRTAAEWIGRCPQCDTRSSRSRGWVDDSAPRCQGRSGSATDRVAEAPAHVIRIAENFKQDDVLGQLPVVLHQDVGEEVGVVALLAAESVRRVAKNLQQQRNCVLGRP